MPITLGKSQWIYIFVIFVIVLPIILCFAFFNQIYASYLHEFVRPKLEEEFGFKSGTESLIDGKEKSEVFLIKFVEPEGILANAGFQSGDIPVGYKHGFESGFYLDLMASRKSEAISMQVLNINAARQGNWNWRDVTLRYKK
jgi:hypothetical protein